MKKFCSLLVALTMLASTACIVNAEAQYFTPNGYVKLEGNIRGAARNGDITINVVDKGVDWAEEAKQGATHSEVVAYYDEAKLNNDKYYSVEFLLTENGEYVAYIGTNGLEEPLETAILYVDEAKFSAAALALIADYEANSAADFADLLEEKKSDVGLFQDEYNGIDFDSYTGILFKENLTVKLASYDSFNLYAKDCLMTELFNKNQISNIKDYLDFVNLNSELKKLLNDTTYTGVTSALSGKNFDSSEEYKNALVDRCVTVAVNTASAGAMVDVLKAAGTSLNISSSVITADLCNAVANHVDFADMGSIEYYIKNEYKAPVNGGGTTSTGSGPNKDNSFVGASASTGSQGTAPKPEGLDVFTDLTGFEWAKDSIKNLYYKGVINGKTETEFCPYDNVTREEFVKMIVTAFKIDLDETGLPFNDVAADNWAYNYINSAYFAKIVRGVSDTEFGYGLNITRQDLCVMVSNALLAGDYTMNRTASIGFVDANNFSEYAKDAIDLLSSCGVISGNESGEFKPHDFATRAEAAKILDYTLNKMSRK